MWWRTFPDGHVGPVDVRADPRPGDLAFQPGASLDSPEPLDLPGIVDLRDTAPAQDDTGHLTSQTTGTNCDDQLSPDLGLPVGRLERRSAVPAPLPTVHQPQASSLIAALVRSSPADDPEPQNRPPDASGQPRGAQAYRYSQSHAQPQDYAQPQSYAQPQDYPQAQDYSQAQDYPRAQDYSQAQASSQPQGYPQAQGYPQPQAYAPPQGYPEPQAQTYPTGYGQDQPPQAAGYPSPQPQTYPAGYGSDPADTPTATWNGYEPAFDRSARTAGYPAAPTAVHSSWRAALGEATRDLPRGSLKVWSAALVGLVVLGTAIFFVLNRVGKPTTT